MAKIAVCYKWVPDEQDIRINASDLSLDFSRAKSKISDYDRNALEEAVLIAEKTGGCEVCALTFGAAVKNSLKDVLSRGPDKVFWAGEEAAVKADGFVTANVLAAMLKKSGSYDLILCGEGAADTYAQQVGPRVAALLGIPVITFVKELTIQGNQVSAVRKLGDCTETVVADFPVLVTVLPEVNKPRIPGLKQVLAASKKPQTEIKLDELGLAASDLTPKTTVTGIRGYVLNRKNIVLKDGTMAERVEILADALVKEGVLA